jgi:GT2 family glycosyltransferase
MDLSIIIVNWKSASFCADCLTSIYAGTLPPAYEIIVIDNASFDGCGEMIHQRFPSVRFIQNRKNSGFAAANNIGFSASRGDIICFLNPDTIVKGNALQMLYDALLNIPGAGAAGALLFNADGSLQTSCVLPLPTILNQVFDSELLRRVFPMLPLFGMNALFTNKQLPQKVDAVSGACIMVKRQVFLEAGTFSTDYFMYAEDIDLCHKIKLTGRDIYFIKTAEIIHIGGQSSCGHSNQLFSALLTRQSIYQFLCKFRGRSYAFLYRMTFGISAVARLVLLLICLVPATVVLRGHLVGEMMLRWWYLLAWCVGATPSPLCRVTEEVDK